MKKAWSEHVDFDNLERLLNGVNVFGAEPGPGVSRLGYGTEEELAHRCLADELQAMGCLVANDPFGNLFGFTDGGSDEGWTAPAAKPAILIGSHLDSVPNGGRYDGALGVVMAPEIARIVTKLRPTSSRQLAVVAWRCEESARFNVGTVGSRLAMGQITLESARHTTDDGGTSLFDAVGQLGFENERIGAETLGAANPHAYLEVHIEQGPVIEALDLPVGVVTGISNQSRLRVNVTGKTMHSGATPVGNRHDALAGAANVILAVESIVHEHGGPNSVGHVDARALKGAPSRRPAPSPTDRAR